MEKIILLDEKTINKIAAGEVVERPANVVKELVENAIDAHAKNISIEIKGGGIDYIRVSDNGLGIDKENIPLAFCRHATSKISCADDLMCISSLGFRGEALSSIAAVSSVEMMTKTASSLLGYHYHAKGGVQMSFDEAGCPDGTTIIVKDLFYNTPARRKFLKSATVEANHITELVQRLILSHPDISFKYTVSGIVKLSSSGLGDDAANIYSVFGREISKSLVEVSFTSENCSISGFVGKPEAARGNRDYELFFVNGRSVKSRVLSSALEEAYKPYLMLHRFPFAILFLDIPPELLDVNVHPAKTEIRLMHEREVYAVLCDTVTKGITRRELIPEAALPNSIPEPSFSPAQKEPVTPVQKSAPSHSEGAPDTKDTEDVPPEPFESARIKRYMQREKEDADKLLKETEPVQETLFKEGFLSDEGRPQHTIIGQVFDTYWIIEYEGKMYIIDQHAAHEKVLYERISKQVAANDVMSQLVSPPVIVSLSAAEEEILTENMTAFTEMGFSIEHFGAREYALSAVPVELFSLTGREYFLEMLDDLASSPSKKGPDSIKNRIATMACKAAVKGNMRMSVAEADALIDELLSLDNPYNCPHGRPTVISFSRADLEKLFKRIV